MKPRILIVHNRYQKRGGEDLVVEAEEELLSQNGHEVKLYEKNNKSITAMSKTRLVIETIWSFRTKKNICTIIEQFQPDIIHVHNTFPLISPSIYWAASQYGIPVVQTLHNFRLFCPQAMLLREGRICEDCVGSFPWSSIVHKCYHASLLQTSVVASALTMHRLIKTYENKVSAYIALTDFSKNKFVQAGMSANNIYVKPNFVKIPYIESKRRENGLFVGRLSPEKGLACLMAAVNRMPGININIIGAGEMRGKLESCSQLKLHGWKDANEVYSAMRSASYLVVPSIWYETFGLIVIEAFANGLPVLASKIGALSELISDGETGLLFEAGSAKSLAEKIAWAESHTDELIRMGKCARQEYEAKYSPQTNYEQLMKIYEHILL